MEKWNDIVLSLLDCKNRHVDEEKYQEKIEELFKFLGWSIILNQLKYGNEEIMFTF